MTLHPVAGPFTPNEPAILIVGEANVRARGVVVSYDGDRAEATVRVEVLEPNPEKVLRREGWRARLVAIESRLDTALRMAMSVKAHPQDNQLLQDAIKINREAWAEITGLIDGDTGSDGLVNLNREDFRTIDSWHREAARSEIGTHASEDALLARLRREVGA